VPDHIIIKSDSATHAEVDGLRNEMIARFEPLSADVVELKDDVKGLRSEVQQVLMFQAGEKAISVRQLRVSTRLLSWAALLVGALSPLAWTHHF
jgi:hypothetical protein